MLEKDQDTGYHCPILGLLRPLELAVELTQLQPWLALCSDPWTQLLSYGLHAKIHVLCIGQRREEALPVHRMEGTPV